MKGKKIFIMGLVISLLVVTSMLSGCTGRPEEGKEYIETFIIHKEEKRRIAETNYSLLIRDIYKDHSVGDSRSSVFAEVYENSEYKAGQIIVDLAANSDAENEYLEIDGKFIIVLDGVPEIESAKISIYLI